MALYHYHVMLPEGEGTRHASGCLDEAPEITNAAGYTDLTSAIAGHLKCEPDRMVVCSLSRIHPPITLETP